MTRKRKAPKVPRETKRLKEENDEQPDPNSEDFYYDECDQYNRDREKILLGDALKSRQKKKVVEEEVLPVEEGYDSDENEENIENWEKQIRQLRMQTSSKVALIAPNEPVEGDSEEEKKETTWGRKRADEYGADVTDDVDISDSDENAALLEEKEALAIQRRQLEQIDECDFDFERFQKKITPVSESIEKEEKDESQLTLEEKRELVKKESPELVPLYLDTIQKCAEVKKILCPIVEAYKNSLLPKHELFEYLQSKLGLYSVHFANVAFYRALKLKRADVQNHPVVFTIFSYIEKFKKLKKIDQRDAPAVHFILKALKKGKPELVTVKKLDQLLGKDGDSTTEKINNRVKFAEELDVKEEEANFDNLTEEDDRAVDYTIERNKGITPKRKKINRNPRIKYKEKYRKALLRQRGQRPKLRDQLHPYAGEISGIRMGVRRGIKLKV